MFKLKNLVSKKNVISNIISLVSFEKKIFSQNGEDGITMKLIKLIYNNDNTDKYYVEFGVENGIECNTRILRGKIWLEWSSNGRK